MKFNKIPYILGAGMLAVGLLAMGGCAPAIEPEYAVISTGNTATDGRFTYDVYENRTAVITGGEANDICLEIPAMIDGYPVVEIGKNAFAGNTKIQYLTLGENVRTISFNAFGDCAALMRVDASPALHTVESAAFSGCQLLCEFNGATKLACIRESAFFQCVSLTAAPLPQTLRTLEGQAFYGCSSLTEVILPKKLTAIGDGTFAFCESLSLLDLGGITVIPANAFQRCVSLCTVKIGKQVTSIEESAFRSCVKLSDITVANSVTDIGYCAFEETAWMEAQTEDFVIMGNGVLLRYHGTAADVTLPKEVRSIADAFCDNRTLKSVTIPAQVTKIGSAAFSGCSSLSRVTVGKNVAVIADTAFAGCSSLSTIYLPKALTSIGNGAFNGCSLLATVRYAGSAKDFAKILIDAGNSPLLLAELLTGQNG